MTVCKCERCGEEILAGGDVVSLQQGVLQNEDPVVVDQDDSLAVFHWICFKGLRIIGPEDTHRLTAVWPVMEAYKSGEELEDMEDRERHEPAGVEEARA
jgi:hypothetical protein